MAKQYGLVFDLKRCIGCYTCVIACKMENDLEELHSGWIKIFTNGGKEADIPVGKYPDLTLSWQPVTCMHCQDPPCLKACPTEAIYKRSDGIVLINKDKCTGCGLCLPACPYGVIRLNGKKNLAGKCTLCSPRIDKGLIPLCVKECICGAIHFGDIGDPDSDVSRLIARRNGYVLKPEKGSRPANHYLEP